MMKVFQLYILFLQNIGYDQPPIYLGSQIYLELKAYCCCLGYDQQFHYLLNFYSSRKY
jgi:hypothetical protein